MPGHRPGHLCLQLELKNETVFLPGDLYHFNEQREFRRVPKFNSDVQMTLKSMEKFEKLVNEKKAKVIISMKAPNMLFGMKPPNKGKVYPCYLNVGK